MLRSTSVVPPRNVKDGAVSTASASSRSNSPGPAGSTSCPATCRSISTTSCSYTVPMSFTSADSTAGAAPCSSERATASESCRIVQSFADARPTAARCASSKVAPNSATNCFTRPNTDR
jgi:hypothetical protein